MCDNPRANDEYSYHTAVHTNLLYCIQELKGCPPLVATIKLALPVAAGKPRCAVKVHNTDNALDVAASTGCHPVTAAYLTLPPSPSLVPISLLVILFRSRSMHKLKTSEVTLIHSSSFSLGSPGQASCYLPIAR
jgi:hypothetical protein